MITKIAELYFVTTLVHLLTKEWTEKDKAKIKTSVFYRFANNLKKFVGKFPGGNSKLVLYFAAYSLLKEEMEFDEDIDSMFDKFISDNEIL